jgi:hypothetical protein
MKKMTLFLATALVITACSKSNGTDPALLENYPQTWILTRDEVANEYLFLKTNGAVFYRDNIPTTYSLTQLAEDEKCEFEINTSRTEDNSKLCYSIRLDKNKNIWCGASPSSNKQEIHLTALNAAGDPGDSYKWFIHKMDDVNGVKTVVLENVYYAGYYISSGSPGSQYAQNLAVLQESSSPEKATAWQCR